MANVYVVTSMLTLFYSC